jgi:hypothetical protein
VLTAGPARAAEHLLGILPDWRGEGPARLHPQVDLILSLDTTADPARGAVPTLFAGATKDSMVRPENSGFWRRSSRVPATSRSTATTWS